MVDSSKSPDSRAQKTVLQYLPSPLIQEWVNNTPQEPIWGKWLTGSLMHCDVTGFTAMSEALAKTGKEGAELMATILNRFFERMISLAGEWGGAQMKFGGDAMLLYFTGHDHALRASACGLELQKAMREFHRVKVLDGYTTLRMRIGIHSGRFYSASTGQQQGLLHYLLIGKDVNETALVEPMAEPGEVVISEACKDLLDQRSYLSTTAHQGIYKVKKVVASKDQLEQIDTSKVPVEILRRYLMPPIANGMTLGLKGENRRVIIVFIDLHGAAGLLDRDGENVALQELNTYMDILFNLVSRHGGYLSASDVAEEGDKLIVLFGAPVSLDKPEASAMRFALGLRDSILNSGLHLKQHIGINSGYVFSGEIGSLNRREYTVIGDSVNLSARLMAAADMNTILVSEATATRAGGEFDLCKLDPIRVKGKSQPIDICRLDGFKSASAQKHDELPFLGRDAELALLSKVAAKTLENRSACAYVSDKPGIGKSRLCEEFSQSLEAEGWQYLKSLCQRHTADTPFSAWRVPLRVLFGLKVSDPPEVCWQKLYAAVTEIDPGLKDFAVLVADVLLISGEENPVVNSMDSKTRHERRLSTIVKLLNHYARINPIVVLIEDVQWIDGPSCELVNTILSKQSSRILICLNSRSVEVPEHITLKPDLEINLPELTENISTELVASYPHIEPERISAIVEKSSGNPLFISELLKSHAAGAGALPETVYDVIMVRLDQLTEEKKNILRLASVIGHNFEYEILKLILISEIADEQLNIILSGLVDDGFLEPHADRQIYEFSNNLAWEVVYETLLYASRRRIHKRVAEAIEKNNTDNIMPIAGLLTHHYEQAGMQDKFIHYGVLAGDHAASMFANDEAFDYYKKTLHSLKQNYSHYIGDLSALYERIGDVYQTTGHDNEAESSYMKALTAWHTTTKGRRSKFIKHDHPGRLSESVISHKIAISCERKSEWDKSIDWVNKALDAIPDRPGSLAAQICATKSGILLRKGEYQEAIKWAKEALQRSEKTKDTKSKAHARNALALSYIESGQLTDAVECLQKAITLYEELGDYSGLLTANSNLGGCLQYTGDFDAAARHYKIALDVSKQMDNVLWVAISSSNLAELYIIWGEIDEAIKQLNVVADAYNDNLCSPAIAGFSFINLSRCHMAQKDYPAAMDSLNKGIDILKELGATGLLVEADLQLVELWLEQGKASDALKSCKQVLKKIKELDAKMLQVKGERLMGMCLIAVGEIEAATIHIRESVELGKKVGADLEHARSLIALAKLSMEDLAGFSHLTSKYINSAIEIFERIGAKLDLKHAQQLLEKGAT